MTLIESLPDTATKHLIRSTYAQLDDLLDQLTDGKAWNDTVYHYFFCYTKLEIEAKMRYINTAHDEFYRLLGRPTADISGAEQAAIVSDLHDAVSTPANELIELISYALSTTSLYGLYEQPHDTSVAYIINTDKLYTLADDVFDEMGLPSTNDMILPSIIGEKQLFLSAINLSPIYRSIFAALGDTDYRWRYHHVSLDFLMDMRPQEDDSIPSDLPAADIQLLSSLYDDHGHPDGGSRIDQLFEQMQKEVPPDILMAYFDVYQEWPAGYPPQKEDYMH